MKEGGEKRKRKEKSKRRMQSACLHSVNSDFLGPRRMLTWHPKSIDRVVRA